jgi:DNA primase
MNRAVPDEIVEEIRSRCDVVDIIRGFIPIKKAGPGRWKALCPFHQEKTPSFTITEQSQRYHCFGCGRGGDVFRFIMDWEKVDFPNAIHLLAAKCGVIIPEQNYSSPQERQQAKARASRRERLYQINKTFAEWYSTFLNNNPQSPVAQYLQTRGIPPEIAEKFQIGASPDAWDASLNHGRQLGFSQDELLESGIVLANEQTRRIYDRFRNRLVFPIWNEQGRVVGFSARTIEAETQGAKYVNSPETPVFKKSNILYALPLARHQIQEQNMAILCEGQLDVIAMHRAGFCNAVAPQGTAFTDEQARILKRYTDRIYLSFDSDTAGIKATVRAIEIMLPLDFEIKIIRFPQGEDPDGIFSKGGTEGLKHYIDNATDMLDFLCDAIFPKHDPQSPYGKSRIIAEIIAFLRKINKPVAREMYIQRLSARLRVRPEIIFQEMNKLSKAEKLKFSRHEPMQPVSAPNAEPTAQPEQQQLDIPKAVMHAEKTLLELALKFEKIGNRLAEELPPEDISQSVIGKALNELINTCLNGEWEHAAAHLNNFERENHSPELSLLLASESTYNKEKAEKAVEECLTAIKKHYADQQKNELMNKLRQAITTEEKQALMKQLLELTAG